MTTIPPDTDTDCALKAKHRALWASGDYPTVAAELIPTLGEVLVEAADIRSGQRVLDVAAGSGNAAIPAAARGATVVASDLTPELFVAGRAIAAQRGVELDWVEADAEALAFDDDSFDAVISVVGAMFAPHHRQTADEMLRVCRPGGTIAMINWTPQGLIGNLFKTMGPYAPPPPRGATPPPLWGDEQHVRDLFGDRVTALDAHRQSLVIDRFADPTEFREFWKRNYGPTIAVSATTPRTRIGSRTSSEISCSSSPHGIGPMRPVGHSTRPSTCSSPHASGSPHRASVTGSAPQDRRTHRIAAHLEHVLTDLSVAGVHRHTTPRVVHRLLVCDLI